MNIWNKIKEAVRKPFQGISRSFKHGTSQWKADEADKNKDFFDRHFVMMRRKPGYLVSILTTTLLFFLIFAMMVGVAGVGAFLGVARGYLDATPELDINEILNQDQTSFIYDKDDNLVTEYYGLENRESVPIEEIPEMLQNAFIAIEDVRFRAHNGVDFKRFFGAIVHNLSNDTVQGGSTITQQLIKQTILTPEQSYKRKIQEMYLAMELEKTFSKDEILDAYLNLIPLGGSNYGVKAAAEDYFGKEDLNQLTLQECAMLAGITRNPWANDPRKNIYERDTPEVTCKRTNLVLSEMYENGYITEEQYNEAKFDVDHPENNTYTVLAEGTGNDYPMKYFIEYAMTEVQDQLMKANGWEGEEGKAKANQMIFAGGLRIYTTLDPALQQSTEQAVYEYEKLPSFRNSIDTLSKNGVQQPQAAAMVMDYHTGEIRAIVGGKQPPTGKKQLNRATNSQALLPMGSAIKPLSVYGPFIEAGYPGGIILDNIPAAVEGWAGGERPYPLNYDGPADFTGPVTARYAIRKSLNIIAAEIVTERIGTATSAQTLRDLGFKENEVTELPSDLALGTHGNTMLSAIGGYGTIANKGVYQEPITVRRVEDKNGNEILNRSNQIKRQVFKETTTFILTDWMHDVVSGGTTTIHLYNEAGQEITVAGKTGTNNDFRGCYFAGFTPYYVGAVWLGHDDFTPQFKSGTTGSAYASPLWTQIMTEAHKNLEPKNFYDAPPEGVHQYTVCGVSGKTPVPGLCDADPAHPEVTEWFPDYAKPDPEDVCDMHISADICSYSGAPAGPYCPQDAIVHQSAVVLRPDSRYQLLTDEQIQQFLPGAVRDISAIVTGENTCPLHTERWYEQEGWRRNMRSQADTLISTVKNHMNDSTYKPLMTSDEKRDLDKLINQLEDLLDAGNKGPPVPGEYYTELPVFDSEAAQDKIDELRDRDEEIIDRIEGEMYYYHKLTTSVTGKGEVIGGGTYKEGDVIDVKAKADKGWHFDYWTGPVADADDPTTTVTMGGSNISITAIFVKDSDSTPSAGATPTPTP